MQVKWPCFILENFLRMGRVEQEFVTCIILENIQVLAPSSRSFYMKFSQLLHADEKLRLRNAEHMIRHPDLGGSLSSAGVLVASLLLPSTLLPKLFLGDLKALLN